MTLRRTARTLAFAVTGLAASFPAASHAQFGDDGFLFREPRTTLTLRGGWALASAKSDLYAFTTEQLTLDRGDFGSLAFGVDVALRPTHHLPRTRIVVSLGISSTSKLSEFRNFVDNDLLPIEQTTSFSRTPLTLGIKQYLTSTGRSVGRFAWIPARFTPYVGAGGGVLHYRFKQVGDFVDFETLEVFAGQLASSGWTPTGHVHAGLDYWLAPRFALTVDSRYLWSSAELSRDFSGFQRLDLSGLATTAGLTVRF